MQTAVEFQEITKKFGDVIANDNISFKINYGEILALLGENGSGKTTLMNMLSGIYYPDNGNILINNQIASIKSPIDAFNYKIGMIHQHFKLIETFTACQNIILGLKDEKFLIDKDEITEKIQTIIDKYGFDLNPNKKIYDMSVSEKQTVEIIKVLYRGANILILDEPTAVLTPQETDKLFQILKKMKEDGKAIVIITHKMHEVLSLSDNVAILRKGKYITTIKTSEATEQILTEEMVGEKIELNINRSLPVNTKLKLKVENLSVLNEYGTKALNNVSFEVYTGEILGIAGIAGSGQKELLEAIAGLKKVCAGSSILFYKNVDNVEEVEDASSNDENTDVTTNEIIENNSSDNENNEDKIKKNKKKNIEDLLKKSPKEIKKLGISLAFVPEDRLGMGLVGNMNMIDNMLIRSYQNGHLPFLKYNSPKKLAQEIKDKLEVVTPSINTPVRKLSGGNVQKILVGREIATNPQLLMTAYAVRGLDINTSYTIYNILNSEKENGTAVVYVGEDLDVLLELCDRILVLCAGEVSGIVDARTTTKQEIGKLMTQKSSFMEVENNDTNEAK